MFSIDPQILLCCMAVFSPWKTQSQWNYFLVFLLMIHLTLGNNRNPLIVLDQYEGNGIRLTCTSEMLSPELQLLWVDGEGEELLAAPAPATPDNTSIASSVLLQPGSGNSVSCRIVSKSTKTSAGSSTLVIADIFFPSTSRWMVAFFVIVVLGIVVIIAICYTLKKNRQKLALSENEQKAIEEEIGRLKIILEKEKNDSERVLKEVQDNCGKTMAELEFRTAYSHAVNITLDPQCTHPEVTIKEKNRIKLSSSSGQKDLKRTLIAVANEGFSSGKQYWEVEVGGSSFWELGVLTKTVRTTLRTEKLEKPLEEGYVSMQRFQSKYYCIGGDSLTDSQNEECEVVGVFLDLEEKTLSFYNVQLMCPIRLIPVEFSEKMYPFFIPGNNENFLSVRPVSSPPCLASL